MQGKILYVDDEYPNRIMFQLTYKNELDILLAASADEGLAMIEKHDDIAIVITDMRMPKKDGLDFVVEAKEINDKITYCLLTGFGVTEEIQYALDHQVINKYFKKPFDKKEILEFILGERID